MLLKIIVVWKIKLVLFFVFQSLAFSKGVFIIKCLAVFNSFYSDVYSQRIQDSLKDMVEMGLSIKESKIKYLNHLGYNELIATRLLEERPDLADKIIFSPFRNKPLIYYRGINLDDFSSFDRFHSSTKIWVTKSLSSARFWASRGKGRRIILRYQIPKMFITSGGHMDGQEEIMLNQPIVAIFSPPYIDPDITRDQKLFLEAYMDLDSGTNWIKIK